MISRDNGYLQAYVLLQGQMLMMWMQLRVAAKRLNSLTLLSRTLGTSNCFLPPIHSPNLQLHAMIYLDCRATLYVYTFACRQGKVDSLMQIIAAQPSDYSYFNCPLLNTWAGPQHWKMKAMRKGGCLVY